MQLPQNTISVTSLARAIGLSDQGLRNLLARGQGPEVRPLAS